MNPPNPQRQRHALTQKQQETLERARKRRFAGILAALEANGEIRERALAADASGPERAPGAGKNQQGVATK